MSTAENPAFQVVLAHWPSDREAIAGIRRAVFIEEQGVPEALEWEDRDPLCDWFLARQGDEVLGIARLTPDSHVGRMAVLPAWRGRGVGSALLQAALDRASQKGLIRVSLHAQTHAVPFYTRFGFGTEGEEFLEAGIPHRKMTLTLKEQL